MATCVAQQSSTQLPAINCPQKFLRTPTYDSRKTSAPCRKRLLSEQSGRYIYSVKYPDADDGIKKRTKTGNCVIFLSTQRIGGRRNDRCFRLYSRSFSTSPPPTRNYNTVPSIICSLFFQPIECFHDSRNKHTRHGAQYCSFSFFQTRSCRSAPVLPLRQNSLTHRLTSIKHTDSTQSNASFLPTLSAEAKNNMLICQQTTPLILNGETDKNSNSFLLTSSELAAFINNRQAIFIIDCGSPLRHTERRIQDSFLLNVNDKISRKRLATRGLKNFLDANQFNRLEQNQVIVLYDDSIRAPLCTHLSTQSQLSPSMKCIYDEVKRYDENKIIYVLQSPFNDFHQHYPSLCYVSTSTDNDLAVPPPPSPAAVKQSDIDFCQISEILPGLYLGSSRDAEDLNVLKEHQIKTIINISTTLPCYFETDNTFEYRRIPCHDSPNQNIVQYFETTFEYIHQQLSANRNVLIHCQAGISRSPSFIIGYLMRCYSKTFDEAYDYTRSKRSIVSPNLSFICQLQRYQQILADA